MKILMVHDIGALIGGAEFSLMRIRSEMIERGHQVRVITGDAPPPDPDFSDFTFHAGDDTARGKFINYLYNRSARQTVRQVIDSFGPDVIHACTVTKLSPAGVRAMRGVPTVMDLRDYGLLYPHLHKILPAADFCGYGDEACCWRHTGIPRFLFERLRVDLHRRNFRHIAAFLVNSEYFRHIAEQMQMLPAINLNNPIETGHHAPGKRDFLPDSILYAGRLEPEKGVLELLQSFVLVRKVIPGSRLYIAGEGSLEPRILACVDILGLQDSVKLLGMLGREDLADWYERVQLVAVPSLWPEPFGLVGPEAMSHGVPVVASGKGGITDWLDSGKNGLIADPLDAQTFADALVSLLTNKKIYQTFSKNALESVEKFRTDTYMDALETIYRDALEESR